MTSKTLTLHNFNKSHREHNVRNINCVGNMEHVDQEKTKYNITLKDEKIVDAYKRLFQDAVDEYNAKQQNPQRKIANYYQHVKKSNMNCAYELVIQIGDRNTTGSDYDKTQTEREILIDYYKSFVERNKNLECIGYYIHYDEATLHAHLCYVPVADKGYKNGVKKRPALVRSLEQQGYVKKGKLTAQIQWEANERKVLKEICKDRGIDIIDEASDKHKHMEKTEYIQNSKIKENEKTINETLEDISILKNEIVNSINTLKELKGEILDAEKVKDMTLGKNILGKQNKNVKLTYKDYIDLKTTAALVDTIEHIKDQEINQEKQINNQLMAENDKLSDEKSRYKLDLYKADRTIIELERTLDYCENKLNEISETLQQEKAYTKSLEAYMDKFTLGNNSLYDMFLENCKDDKVLNRAQRRAKNKKKNYEYDYENDYYNDDPRYY